MKAKDFTVTKVNTYPDECDPNIMYADFVITQDTDTELLTQVLLPKTKKQLIDMCSFGSRLEV